MTILNRFLFLVLFLVLTLVSSFRAHAACIDPAGNEGEITYNTTYKTMQFCDGTKWWSMKGALSGGDLASKDYVDAAIAAGGGGGACYYTSGGGCAAGYESVPGAFYSGGNAHNICCPGGSASSDALPKGYFVQTFGEYGGDLGGMAGADEKCLTELTNYPWKGKADAQEREILDTDHVEAWLCDDSSCNNFKSFSSYEFAHVGYIERGGAEITTGLDGVGFTGNNSWNGSSYFYDGGYYWTGRNSGYPSAGSGYIQINSQSGSTCSNWTTTASSSGVMGYGSSANTDRWYHSANNCSSERKLICLVHPN